MTDLKPFITISGERANRLMESNITKVCANAWLRGFGRNGRGVHGIKERGIR